MRDEYDADVEGTMPMATRTMMAMTLCVVASWAKSCLLQLAMVSIGKHSGAVLQHVPRFLL